MSMWELSFVVPPNHGNAFYFFGLCFQFFFPIQILQFLISLISITGPLNLIDNNSPQNSKAYLDVCFSDDLFVSTHGEN